MRSSSVQGSFNAAEVDPTRINTSLTTLQPAMQAVTGACRALLGGSAWKGRHIFWKMERVATGAEVPCALDLRTSIHYYL